MVNDSLIHLDNIKTSFYEKGIDLVNVHLYVRDVDENEDIVFEENKVICKFSTSNPKFVQDHASDGHGTHAFCFVINTREAIDSSKCYYVVKAPYIEIILKKKVAQKWKGLFAADADDMAEPSVNGKKKTKGQSKRSKDSQLLGGKSTPMKTNEEKKQEADVKMENRASSSKTEDERNIKKAVFLPDNAALTSGQAGLTGLENYANNCYMNVVIQILANIQETRDYFRNDHYLKDINANNPLSSGGKVAKAFADVAKALWSVRKNAFKPSALKNIMGKRYSLFLGWQQHDAQEFFSSLLDNLHEDLNQVHCEKGAEKESNKVEVDSTVNEKPDTAWAAHLKRNNSFIVKLFHGQLMSKLTCAACHKVSYSYDPCAQISLPILTTKLHLKILFFTRDINKPPLMVSMQISTPNAKVWHLKNMLQTVVKVPSHLISLFNGIYNVCADEQAPVLSVRKYKYVVASEISTKDEVEFISIPVFQYVLHSGQFVHCDNCFTLQSDSTKLKRCTRCLAVAYCTRECQMKHWHVHSKACVKDLRMQVGVPFYMTIRKDSLTFELLEECLRDRAKFSVESFSSSLEEHPNIELSSDENIECDKQPQKLSLASAQCVIKVSNKPINDETCVVVNSDNFSPDVIFKASYIVLEWQNCPEGEVSTNIRTKSIPVHEVLNTDTNTGMTEEEDQCSIYDCLRLFMEPESLDKRDSWKCPKCKNLQAAKKEMAISSPPGLLLLHLKRFTYGDFGQKINKAVSYPLSNFDISPFIAKETRSRIEHPLIYDLCGVITHRGSMRMGHYTCLVRMLGMNDQEEIGWRFFDDDSVVKIGGDKVVSSDAYVLVYRIQGAREVLKLNSIYPENVKRKSTDVVAGASAHNPNAEKFNKMNLSVSDMDSQLLKQSLSLEEHHVDSCATSLSPLKRSLSLGGNYGNDNSEHVDFASFSDQKVDCKETLSEYGVQNEPDVMNYFLDNPTELHKNVDENNDSSTSSSYLDDDSDISGSLADPTSVLTVDDQSSDKLEGNPDEKESSFSISSDDHEFHKKHFTNVKQDSDSFSSMNNPCNKAANVSLDETLHTSMFESFDGFGVTTIGAAMDPSYSSPTCEYLQCNSTEAVNEEPIEPASDDSSFVQTFERLDISNEGRNEHKDSAHFIHAEDQYFQSTTEGKNSKNCTNVTAGSDTCYENNNAKDVSDINEDDLD